MFSPYVTSSGLQTASAVISAQAGGFAGIDVIPPETGYSLAIVYDSSNSTTSGKTVLAIYVSDSGALSLSDNLPNIVAASQGIYVDFTSTGTGGSYVVRYAVG